jgi:hypothetical protein
MGWRERNKPEGHYWLNPHPRPLHRWRTRWFSLYQEKRLWDKAFGRLARSASRLRDGYAGEGQIRLQRNWKRFRKTRFKPKEID